MPPEGFRARVTSNVVPVAARQGAGTGEAIGEGLSMLARTALQANAQDAQAQEQIANSETRIAAEQRRREISAHAADRLGAWAQLQADVGKTVLDIRTNSKPGAVGHKEEVVKYIRDTMDTFMGTLADEPEVMQRFEPMLLEYEARTLANEDEWELQKRAKHQGDSFKTYVETTGNQVLLDPSPGRYQQMVTDGNDIIDMLDVDGTVKAALKSELLKAATTNLRDGMIQRGQLDQLDALVKSGFLNDKGIDLNRTIDIIGNERKAMQIAADQAESDARSAARDNVKALEEKIKLGINPSAEEISAARSEMARLGLESEVVALDGMNIQIGLNRTYNEAADPMGTRAAAAASRLRAKVAAGTASEAEQVSYAHLKGIAEGRADKAGKALRDTAAQGVQGKQTVLAQLSSLPVEQRFTAAEAAGEGLGYLSLLKGPVQASALRGMEDLKANPKLIDNEKASVAFRGATRTAQLGLSEEAVQGHISVANALYTDFVRQAGANEAAFNPKLYQKAVRMAFGGVQRDGEWLGGLGLYRQRSVILPDGFSDDQFDRVISRLTFADAVYADGSKASKPDILANYAPVYIGDTDTGKPMYIFRGKDGSELKMKDGRPFPVIIQ